jgi:hypothetical protein
MTIIKRIYFEPSDILAIQLECRKCGATISCRLKDWKPAEVTCPNCFVQLIKDGREALTLKMLADSLNALLTYNDTLSFRLRLEFVQQD